MTQTSRHRERSLAVSEADSQTQSKDRYGLETRGSDAGNFRVVVRFFDDHETECNPVSSREAATQCSPRRKPWDPDGLVCEPRRDERKSCT